MSQGLSQLADGAPAQLLRNGNVLEIFEISSDYIELNKLLKASGLCDSGGMAKSVITGGQVLVDGSVEYRVRCKIRKGQTVSFHGRRIRVGQAPRPPQEMF